MLPKIIKIINTRSLNLAHAGYGTMIILTPCRLIVSVKVPAYFVV